MNDSFIDRPAVRADLLRLLDSSSVLLHGARRIGKSTLLQQIVETPPYGTRVVRIDLEGLLASPVEELATALHNSLVEAGMVRPPSALAQRVASVEVAGNSVELREGERSIGWSRVEGDLSAAFDSGGANRLIVALDEVPWWLDAIAERSGAPEARSALATLRRLRQSPRFDGRLRMVLTGSIGLAGLAASLEASAELNDLATLSVPPMTRDEGASLFETEATARGATCTPAAARHAARLAGGSPHWVKVLAAAVGTDGSTAEKVDAAAETLLVPQQRRLFADEGQEHFRRRHRDLYPVLVAILEAVSAADDGHPLEAAVTAALAADSGLTRRRAEECVWLLVDGFYLQADQERISWVNPLFRRWWLRFGGA